MENKKAFNLLEKHIESAIEQNNELNEALKKSFISILERLQNQDSAEKVKAEGLPKRIIVSSDIYHHVNDSMSIYAEVVEARHLDKMTIIFSWDESHLFKNE